MESEKKFLLSTRPLPGQVIEEAATKNIIIEVLSFIDTQPVIDDELAQKIKTLAAEKHAVVFTSMNAVEAVAAHVTAVPGWRIYSMGNTTRQLIEEKWGADKIVASAENAMRLGERLVDDAVKEAVFFCGNIRRHELPNKMRSEGGVVEEVVVYQTEETPTKLAKVYDGILFFSPSAAHAFFKQNKADKATVFFAIGKTTAEALRQYKVQKIKVGHVTDKIELAQQAIDFFARNKLGK